jgi:hypothetical protein
MALMDKFGDGAEYDYVDSQGVPSANWVTNLYMREENHLQEAEWITIYRGLSEWVSLLHKQERVKNPIFLVHVGDTCWTGVEKHILQVASAKPDVEDLKTGKDIVMERDKGTKQKVEPVREIELKRGPKKDSSFGEQLLALFKADYALVIAEVNKKQEQAAVEDPERVKKIKYPKWKNFGMSVKEIMKKANWSLSQVKDASDEIGYLIQDGWCVKEVIVNDRVDHNIIHTADRATERVKEPVIASSKDRQKVVDSAPKVLSKLDRVGERCASKSVPLAKVKWEQIPTEIKFFFSIVKRKCKDLRCRIVTPDGYWACLTYNNPDIDSDDHILENKVRFRLKFDFDTVDVQQGTFGVRVVTQVNLWVVDYSSGRKDGYFTKEAVPLCKIVGSKKDFNKKVLKNALLKFFFPEKKVPLFVVEEEGGQALCVIDHSEAAKALRAYIINTYFSV